MIKNKTKKIVSLNYHQSKKLVINLLNCDIRLSKENSKNRLEHLDVIISGKNLTEYVSFYSERRRSFREISCWEKEQWIWLI